MQFGFEGWWIADLHSFFTDTPSTLNIEILEDTELLLIDRKNQNQLMQEISGYERYQRIISKMPMWPCSNALKTHWAVRLRKSMRV